MSIEIQVDENFLSMESLLTAFQSELAIKSARRGLNRGIVTGRKKTINLINEKHPLKKSTLKKRHVFKNDAKGNSFRNLEAQLVISATPIPLIAFLTAANRKPKSQKGIKVSRRRKLRVSITRGNRKVLEHAFVAKVKTTQVFKRSDKGKADLKKQGTPSAKSIWQRRRLINKVRPVMVDMFLKTFKSDIEGRINGHTRRARRF